MKKKKDESTTIENKNIFELDPTEYKKLSLIFLIYLSKKRRLLKNNIINVFI